MVLVYAEASDLAEAPWSLDPAPDNADRLIARASQLVRAATRSAVYDVDAAGKPSDEDVLAGFRDAVCAQVAVWVAADIDPSQAGSGQGGVVAAKGMGPRNVQYATYERDAAQRQWTTLNLADEAMGYLRDLPIWYGVWVHG